MSRRWFGTAIPTDAARPGAHLVRRSLSPRPLALRHGPLDIDPAQKRKEDAEGVDLGVKDNDVGDGAVGGGGLVDEDKDGEEHRG